MEAATVETIVYVCAVVCFVCAIINVLVMFID